MGHIRLSFEDALNQSKSIHHQITVDAVNSAHFPTPPVDRFQLPGCVRVHLCVFRPQGNFILDIMAELRYRLAIDLGCANELHADIFLHSVGGCENQWLLALFQHIALLGDAKLQPPGSRRIRPNQTGLQVEMKKSHVNLKDLKACLVSFSKFSSTGGHFTAKRPAFSFVLHFSTAKVA